MKDSTAKTLMSVLACILFFWVLTFARVPYTCKPVSPPEECETGAYEIWFFEHDNARRPHGVVDAHCVYKTDGRLVAETLRLTTYDQTGEIRQVEWFERQEFPDSHAEVCQVK